MPATGEYWLGTGLYARINSGEAVPVAVTRGAVPERERNVSFTASAADFGKIHRVNNGSEVTITVPAGLVAAGQGGRRFWVIRQGAGGVRFAVSGGAVLRSPGNRVTDRQAVPDGRGRHHLGQRRLPARHLSRRRPHPDLGQPPPRAQRQLHGDRPPIWASCTAATTAAPRSRSPCPYRPVAHRDGEDVVELTVCAGRQRPGVHHAPTPAPPARRRCSSASRPPRPASPSTTAATASCTTSTSWRPGRPAASLIRKTDATTGELFLDGVR